MRILQYMYITPRYLITLYKGEKEAVYVINKHIFGPNISVCRCYNRPRHCSTVESRKMKKIQIKYKNYCNYLNNTVTMVDGSQDPITNLNYQYYQFAATFVREYSRTKVGLVGTK